MRISERRAFVPVRRAPYCLRKTRMGDAGRFYGYNDAVPPMRKQTICLSMIVKNEAPVIRRCLDSVRPLIDAWTIVDTGSTDGTQDVVCDALRDLPGQLHER